MSDLSLFEGFAKSGKANIARTGNCVIYTRVSSKRQEDNLSLPVQLKGCKEYAQKNGFTILGYFGGKYESAKTDERKEFNRMLTAIKRSKEKISYILVYSLDRFSRTGPNAIYITSQLKQEGIAVIGITQPTDALTPTGAFQQNIQFLFSQYDNDQRREKCVAGMKERLLQGDWVGQYPIGYSLVVENGEKRVVINATGKLLRKAFYWKANEGFSNVEILKKLEALGLKLYQQQLHKIFRNPYYCGILSHNLLEGKVVEGKQEKLITKELFLKVNDIQQKNPHGYKHKEECPEIPLKHFLKCNSCGKYLTGYIVKKKNIPYYKCRTVGCGCNHSAKQLNEQFKTILQQFSFNESYMEIIKVQLSKVYEKKNVSNKEEEIQMKKQLTEIETKLEKLEEKYIMEEIDREMYQKFASKYKQEKKQIGDNLEKLDAKSSNLEEFIDFTIKISSKLDSYWSNLDFKTKQRLQYLLFPEGIYFDKKNQAVRTERVNEVFNTISSISEELQQEKKGQTNTTINLSLSVERAGFEPAIPFGGIHTFQACSFNHSDTSPF